MATKKGLGFFAKLKNVFYNIRQKRLRAGWRITIFSISFLLLVAIAGLILQSTMPAGPARGCISMLVVFLIALGTLVLASRYVDHRKWKDLGYHFSKKWWQDFLFGLALGGFLICLIFIFEKAMGWVTVVDFFRNQKTGYAGIPFWVPFVMGFIKFAIVGFYEETLSRGYQIKNLSESFYSKKGSGRKAVIWAYILTSVIFGLLHAGNANVTVPALVNLVLAGLFLGLAYVLSGELAIPIGLHITWNFFQGLVFGFPVSGKLIDVSLVAFQLNGPALCTGGAFGPEGGVISTAAMLLGCALVFLYLKIFRKRFSLFSKLAVYRPPKQ